VSFSVSVHQPALDRTLAVSLDLPPDLSCTDSIQADCVDVEHQPTDVAVGSSPICRGEFRVPGWPGCIPCFASPLNLASEASDGSIYASCPILEMATRRYGEPHDRRMCGPRAAPHGSRPCAYCALATDGLPGDLRKHRHLVSHHRIAPTKEEAPAGPSSWFGPSGLGRPP
jgi:hypothetical protein